MIYPVYLDERDHANIVAALTAAALTWADPSSLLDTLELVSPKAAPGVREAVAKRQAAAA